jgi:hypothetical protein
MNSDEPNLSAHPDNALIPLHIGHILVWLIAVTSSHPDLPSIHVTSSPASYPLDKAHPSVLHLLSSPRKNTPPIDDCKNSDHVSTYML